MAVNKYKSAVKNYLSLVGHRMTRRSDPTSSLYNPSADSQQQTSFKTMRRLMILPFAQLLWCSFATPTIIASVGTTTSYYDANARFQKSSAVSGIITTVAGSKIYLEGSVEDGVAATSKKISNPWGLSFDKDGNLYIADSSDKKI